MSKVFNVHCHNQSNKRVIVTVKADGKAAALAMVREQGYRVPNGRYAVKQHVPGLFQAWAMASTNVGRPMGSKPNVGASVEVNKRRA